jgi:hypothetical protein
VSKRGARVRGRSGLLGSVLAAVALCLWSADASAISAHQAIGFLNAQRAANGIPAGIVENKTWSRGCALHGAYLKRHPEQWRKAPHDEDPSKSGYTQLGQRAAQSSVLNPSGGFSRAGANPWEFAPIHLMQLLGPALSVTGYADKNAGCMWTWPGYKRAPASPPVLYTYPGDGTSIYPKMVAYEAPFTPGDFVGLRQPKVTGPYLYVLLDGGPGGRISARSLIGPGGPVSTRVVDDTTPSVGVYLPSGGIIIPAKPLRPRATYTASVTYTFWDGTALDHTWSFRTRRTTKPTAARLRPVAYP